MFLCVEHLVRNSSPKWLPKMGLFFLGSTQDVLSLLTLDPKNVSGALHRTGSSLVNVVNYKVATPRHSLFQRIIFVNAAGRESRAGLSWNDDPTHVSYCPCLPCSGSEEKRGPRQMHSFWSWARPLPWAPCT